jgi:hypothetical protein
MSFHARSNRIAAAGERDLRSSVDTAGGPRSTAQAAPRVYNYGDDEPTRADLVKQLETKALGGVTISSVCLVVVKSSIQIRSMCSHSVGNSAESLSCD